jgi:uroporphyrinogen-III synthase
MDHLRVIVTRPLAQALPWVDALRDAGFDAHALPLIDIEALVDPAPVREAWAHLMGCAMVMFVSANAVQHFFALQPEEYGWPLSAFAGSTGPGTTAALQQAGVPAACILEPLPGAAFDSESLWARLKARHWRGQRVLIVRGEDGRDWLGDQLREAGAEVVPVAAYRRLAPEPGQAGMALIAAAQADPAEHCWFFTSSEAVGHLKELAPQADWASSRALASHLRIAQAARKAGFGDVRLVDPRPQSVVETIASIKSHLRLL